MTKFQKILASGFILIFSVFLSLNSNAQTITNCVEVYSMDQTDPNSTPNNNVTTEDDYACAVICKGGTVKTNTVEVHSMDQTDPNSTPNNGIITEDDIASVDIVMCAVVCTTVTGISISLSPTSPVVAGTTINLTANKTDAGSPTAYTWAASPNTGFTSTTQNATLSNPSAGTYLFTVTIQNNNGTGVCTATATSSLSVSTALTPCTTVTGISISLSPVSPVVAGTTVNLTASKTDAGSPTAYTWAASPNTGFTSTTQNATLSNPSAGTYLFTVTIQNNNGTGVCTATATSSLSVSTALTPCTTVTGASISLSPTSPVVAGTTVNLTANKTDAGSPTAYTWAASPNTGFTSTTQNATLTNPSAGTYLFTVTIQNNNGTGVCTATATSSLSVSTALTPCTTVTGASISLSPTSPVVAGTTVNLTASKTDAGSPTAYTWAASPNAGFTSTTQNATLTNPSAGTYLFTVTIQNNNGTGVCTATATSSLSVSTALTPCTTVTGISISLSPVSPVVAGTTVNLTANKTDAGSPTAYTWAASPNTGFTSTTQNATLTNPSAGTYLFTVTIQNNNGTGVCTATATSSLSVSTALTPCTTVTGISISLSPTSPVVAGTTVNLTASKTDAGSPTAYTWAASPNAGFTSTTQNATLTNPSAGTYLFTVTIQNNNGTGVCTASATSSLSVSTALTPCQTLTGSLIDQTICAGTAPSAISVSTNATAANSVRFVYLTSHSNDAATIYASTNILATVTPLGGVATFTPTAANFPNTTTNTITYHTYAIFNPNPSDVSCRSFVHVHIYVNPVPSNVTANITPPTCAGATAQSNGLLRLSGFTNERYQYSSGATFNAATAIPASPTAIPGNSVLINNLTNTAQTYTVRIFTSNSSTCYIDRTVTLTPVVCNCPPPRCVPISITINN